MVIGDGFWQWHVSGDIGPGGLSLWDGVEGVFFGGLFIV